MTWRDYHDQTKHTPESLRRSTHTLDWANMPDPFRHYEGVPVFDLPADPPSAEICSLDLMGGSKGATNVTAGAQLLSQLLYYSAAVSASKVAPANGNRYALRVNPSSGNLHPTEFHFVARGLREWPDGLYHYRPSSHMAEQRARGTMRIAADEDAPLVFILTTIAWREAWKYQDRAYRYCLLDAGHAAEALMLSARAMGLKASVLGYMDDDSVSAFCRLSHDEWPMLIVAIGAPSVSPREDDVTWMGGEPNRVSDVVVPYVAIDGVHAVTNSGRGMVWPVCQQRGPLLPSRAFGATARNRRSALDFIGGRGSISDEQLLAMLAAAAPGVIDLFLYVHRVANVEPGIYQYADRSLRLIRAGDQRVMAAALSLQQDLAGNACFAVSMVANLERICTEHGPRGYRFAHFEAGAIGQRLYLAAESLGLGATGVGAFFDDEVHRYLNLTPATGEVVYHFAVGYPVEDTRVEALA